MENLKLKGNPARGLIGPTLGFFIGCTVVSLFGGQWVLTNLMKGLEQLKQL